MEQRTLSISNVLGQGWELFKKYWMFAFIVLGVSIVIDIVQSIFTPANYQLILTDMVSDMQTNPNKVYEYLPLLYGGTAKIGSIVAYIVKMICAAGITSMIMMIIKGITNDISFQAFAMPFEVYVKYLIVDFLTNLITVIGLCFCIIPGIYLGLRLKFATYYIIDNPKAEIGEAIKYSWKITKGNVCNLLLLSIVFILLVIAGLCCCCIGVFAALAWIYIADVIAYFTLKPEEEEYVEVVADTNDEEVVSTDTAPEVGNSYDKNEK